MALLELERVHKRFGGVHAIRDVSFSVREGEIVGLVGPNGAGKTTLFHLITGYHPLDQGTVTFAGQNITGWPMHEITRLGVARTFQLERPFLSMSVLENTMVGAFLRHPTPRAARQAALKALTQLGMAQKADWPARSLNPVDRKRLELARALATEPKLLLLDEVFAGLTPTEVDMAANLLKEVYASGVTIIAIEHVMRAIMALSHRIIVIHNGEKLADGPPEQVVRDEKVISAYLGDSYAAS